MLYTNNLNLKKPEQTEYYNVDDFNYNADILDEKFGNISNDVDSIKENYVVKTDIIPIANGGTGATTASDACANIGALPISGGSMSGIITSNTLTFANKKNDSEYFEVIGATDATNGAFLQLYGKDNTARPNSEFRLGNIYCDLKGDSTGDLKWSGKNLYVDGYLIYNGDINNNQRGLELPARNVNMHGGSIILNGYTGLCSVQIDNFNNAIRFVGRTPSDHWATGSLGDIWTFVLNKFGKGQSIVGEGFIAKGNNYIKYASGLIIQWGGGYDLNSGSAINFSIPFSDTNYAFTTSSHDSNGYMHPINILTMSNTGVTISSQAYPAGCRWIAIGY